MFTHPQKNIPQEHTYNFMTLLRPQIKNAALDGVRHLGRSSDCCIEVGLFVLSIWLVSGLEWEQNRQVGAQGCCLFSRQLPKACFLSLCNAAAPWHTHSQGRRIQPVSWAKIKTFPPKQVVVCPCPRHKQLHLILCYLFLLHCLSISTLFMHQDRGNKLPGHLLVLLKPHGQ